MFCLQIRCCVSTLLHCATSQKTDVLATVRASTLIKSSGSVKLGYSTQQPSFRNSSNEVSSDHNGSILSAELRAGKVGRVHNLKTCMEV
jgi:hypothetical protein